MHHVKVNGQLFPKSIGMWELAGCKAVFGITGTWNIPNDTLTKNLWPKYPNSLLEFQSNFEIVNGKPLFNLTFHFYSNGLEIKKAVVKKVQEKYLEQPIILFYHQTDIEVNAIKNLLGDLIYYEVGQINKLAKEQRGILLLNLSENRGYDTKFLVQPEIYIMSGDFLQSYADLIQMGGRGIRGVFDKESKVDIFTTSSNTEEEIIKELKQKDGKQLLDKIDLIKYLIKKKPFAFNSIMGKLFPEEFINISSKRELQKLDPQMGDIMRMTSQEIFASYRQQVKKKTKVFDVYEVYKEEKDQSYESENLLLQVNPQVQFKPIQLQKEIAWRLVDEDEMDYQLNQRLSQASQQKSQSSQQRNPSFQQQITTSKQQNPMDVLSELSKGLNDELRLLTDSSEEEKQKSKSYSPSPLGSEKKERERNGSTTNIQLNVLNITMSQATKKHSASRQDLNAK